jgi:dihydroneopterin aldolase/2-amino-4-hydroxy-6-hydroxymethyldihydropteridine diphosphokinase
MDCIRIQNLEVFGFHGVKPEENVLGQKFILDVSLYTDTRAAGQTDDLTRSIHYGHAAHRIAEFAENHRFLLIERLAEETAEYLLTDFSKEEQADLRRVRITVKKPWAPIRLHVEHVSVTIERGWHRAYVSLGSNMGNRQAYLEQAVDQLRKDKRIKDLKVSSWITTAPYGNVEQEDFLNGAAQLDTLYTPEELLHRMQELELLAGRKRTVHWGPRTLDLDLIFYEKEILETEELVLPHPDMENRTFVLRPMCQLNKNFRHPVLQKTMEQLLQALEEKEQA